MKHSVLLILLAISTIFTACKEDGPVTACFELSSNAINVGDSIDFKSCSENVFSMDWRMSGPDSAAENILGWSDAEFSHTFNTPGDYVVTLKTYSDFSWSGDLAIDSASFSVN